MKAISEVYASLMLVAVGIAVLVAAQMVIIPFVSSLASSLSSSSIDASMKCNRVKNPFGPVYPGIVICILTVTCTGSCGGAANVMSIMYAKQQSYGSASVVSIAPSQVLASNVKIVQGASSVAIVIPYQTGADEPVIVSVTISSQELKFERRVTAYL